MSIPDLTLGDAPQTTEDVFLGGRLRIRQPARGYRAGIDAVLLAASVPAEIGGQSVLDLGAGVGTVGLCVASRCAAARVVLVEREPTLVALARENIAANQLAGQVSVVQTDVARPLSVTAESGLVEGHFASVLANPPYFDTGSGTAARENLKAVSHQMPSDDLDSWIRFMARMARPGGSATIIHRADALSRILSAFNGRFGAVAVRPIYARSGEPAIRVLVEGIKGSRAPLTIQEGLILHGAGQKFTAGIDAVLREGAALPR